MKWLKVVLSLSFFIPACTLGMAFSTLDTRMPLWLALVLGVVVGSFFGLLFGGVKGRWLDSILGPEETPPPQPKRRWQDRYIGPQG